MNKWTPGPWVVDEDRRNKRAPVTGLMVVAEKGGMPGLIVNMGGIVTDTDWANARLIAAAPEMAAFLESFVKANAEGAATEWVTRMCECDKSARALLARIKG